MDVCRVCLAKCNRTRNSKKIFENTTEGFRYDDMIKKVASIEVEGDEILCSPCCADLVICYKFLLKVENANRVWKSCGEDFVKDPLEDTDSDDEEKSLSGDYKYEDSKTNLPDLNAGNDVKENYWEQSRDSLNYSTKSPSLEANDFQSNLMQECEDDEALFNDLSDLTVSAENLIFPRGRFKCKICEKAYFTSVGLTAHQEVHLPKTPAAKKKRARAAKKHKIPTALTETETFDGSNTATNIEESSNGLALEKPKTNRKEKQIKPKKMFPCQVCGKHMISSSKLRYHMVMHTGQKDYLCTMCPKAYSTIYALKFHFRTHSGDRPYTCTFCGDRFTRPTTLKSHVRRHTGERPYGCEVCGKRFIQHSSMTTHIKLNHMAKTIPCSHCDKKYARQIDLNTHMLSHTGDKPFPCQLCPSRFIRQANLNKHMNQHHSTKSIDFQKRHRIEEPSTTQSLVPEDIFVPLVDVKPIENLLSNDQSTS